MIPYCGITNVVPGRSEQAVLADGVGEGVGNCGSADAIVGEGLGLITGASEADVSGRAVVGAQAPVAMINATATE